MSDWHAALSKGLLLLVQNNREYLDENTRRLQVMQTRYLQSNAHLYADGQEVDRLEYYVRVVTYKYYLASLSVEQLQAIRHGRIDQEILLVLENSLDTLDCSDDDRLAVSFALENFLFQAMAFLDVYMLYVCLLLRTGHTGSMTRSRFYRQLAGVQEEPWARKAQWVDEYFKTKVFSEMYAPESWGREDWGTLVTSLRHKIAHRDIIRPSFDSRETLIDGVRLEWPTLQGLTYHAFCEMVRTGMYFLFYDVSSFLYDLDWDDLFSL
jgi:hypothetical protein